MRRLCVLHHRHQEWVAALREAEPRLVSNPTIPTEVPVTRADGQFGFWMARYVLAHLLHGTQRLEECRAVQVGHLWNPKLAPEDLWRESALVLGFGRIGRKIGSALRAIGMEVTGIVRTTRQDPEFQLVTTAALPPLLLINVGRGDLLTTTALLAALDHGTVGHAVQDVFNLRRFAEGLPVQGAVDRERGY